MFLEFFIKGEKNAIAYFHGLSVIHRKLPLKILLKNEAMSYQISF